MLGTEVCRVKPLLKVTGSIFNVEQQSRATNTKTFCNVHCSAVFNAAGFVLNNKMCWPGWCASFDETFDRQLPGANMLCKIRSAAVTSLLHSRTCKILTNMPSTAARSFLCIVMSTLTLFFS